MAKKASFFLNKATFKLLEFISILQQQNVVKKFVTETSVNFIPKNTILHRCPYILQQLCLSETCKQASLSWWNVPANQHSDFHTGQKRPEVITQQVQSRHSCSVRFSPTPSPSPSPSRSPSLFCACHAGYHSCIVWNTRGQVQQVVLLHDMDFFPFCKIWLISGYT